MELSFADSLKESTEGAVRKGQITNDHGVQIDADRPDINFWANVLFAFDQLWRGVDGRAATGGQRFGFVKVV